VSTGLSIFHVFAVSTLANIFNCPDNPKIFLVDTKVSSRISCAAKEIIAIFLACSRVFSSEIAAIQLGSFFFF